MRGDTRGTWRIKGHEGSVVGREGTEGTWRDMGDFGVHGGVREWMQREMGGAQGQSRETQNIERTWRGTRQGPQYSTLGGTTGHTGNRWGRTRTWEVPCQTEEGPAPGLYSWVLVCTGVYWERTSADAEAQHVPAALQKLLPPLPVAPQLQIQQLPQLLRLLPVTHLGMRWE